jgi:hypothetical protein
LAGAAGAVWGGAAGGAAGGNVWASAEAQNTAAAK